MDDNRLNQLAKMSLGFDILTKFDFQNMFDDFLKITTRRVPEI